MVVLLRTPALVKAGLQVVELSRYSAPCSLSQASAIAAACFMGGMVGVEPLSVKRDSRAAIARGRAARTRARMLYHGGEGTVGARSRGG